MVERFVRDEEAAGSNPVTSTIIYGIHKSECRFFCLHSRIMQDSNLLFIAKRDEVCAAWNYSGIHESECRFFIFFCIKPNCMCNFLRIQFGFFS